MTEKQLVALVHGHASSLIAQSAETLHDPEKDSVYVGAVQSSSLGKTGFLTFSQFCPEDCTEQLGVIFSLFKDLLPKLIEEPELLELLLYVTQSGKETEIIHINNPKAPTNENGNN